MRRYSRLPDNTPLPSTTPAFARKRTRRFPPALERTVHAPYVWHSKFQETPQMIHLPQPAHDANANAKGEDLGKLPEWDLSDLYTATDAPELERDLKWLEGECAAFAADYEGKLDTLDAAGLLECIHRDEAISNIAGRIMSFA